MALRCSKRPPWAMKLRAFQFIKAPKRKRKDGRVVQWVGTWRFIPVLLGQWLNGFPTFGDYIVSRENKPFKLFFQGPLAKYIGVITHLLTIDPNFLGHPSMF